MVSRIYPTQLKFKNSNPSDTEAPLFGLRLVHYKRRIVSTKSNDKLDDFNFEIVNFPFVGGDVLRSTSYGVCICNIFILQEFVYMLMTSAIENNIDFQVP